MKPNPENWFEDRVTTNPAAWYEDGKFYLLYRAAGNDYDHLVHLCLAISDDGFNFTRYEENPVVSPTKLGVDGGCLEDPRIIKMDDIFYVTYAYRPNPPGQYWLRAVSPVNDYGVPEKAHRHFLENTTNTGLLMSKDLINYRRMGRITKAYLDDRDVVIFPEKIGGKYWRINRPDQWVGEAYGCTGLAMWITSSNDLLEWEDECKLLIKGEYWWENKKVGGSCPPIKTEDGWVHIYHGVDMDGVYRVGAILLDLNDPSKVIARTPEPIMSPDQDYEKTGVYNGCVFPAGNVVVDGKLYVYYGCADEYCAVATCELQELLDYLKANPWNND